MPRQMPMTGTPSKDAVRIGFTRPRALSARHGVGEGAHPRQQHCVRTAHGLDAVATTLAGTPMRPSAARTDARLATPLSMMVRVIA